MDINKSRPVRRNAHSGFTVIELMIVVTVIAIILALAIPTYQNYSTRAKVAEALSVGAAAKTAVAATCIEDPTIDPLTNTMAGYSYKTSKYVQSIAVSGPCLTPVIFIQTQATGVTPDITITLTGDLNDEKSRMDWTCTTNTLNNNVPRECRL